MATIKKACKGALYPKSSSVSSRLGSYGKKMKSGGSLGMKSVKAGFDKNPGVTRADIIVAGKGEAKKGMMVKAQVGKMQKLTKGKSGKLSPKMQLELEKFKYQRDMDRMKLDREMGKEKESRPSSAPVRIAKKGKMVKKSASKKVMMKTGGKMSKKCKYGCK